MKSGIPNGVWPTMITAFTENYDIDYYALESMVDWYIQQGVDGLFAVCLSSEMYHLSLKERIELSKAVVKYVAGRVPVIASGHVTGDRDKQIKELTAISETGIDALVLVSNHLAEIDENDDVWKANAEIIMNAIQNVPLGIYECPLPYKRLISPELLKWCADTGKFLFLKDTCCQLDILYAKSKAVEGTNLKIFNANSATLLDSMKVGIAGFSGIMANFHPDLYVWLINNFKKEPEKAETLQNFLGLASLLETQYYPVSAKYNMQLNSLPIKLLARNLDIDGFTELHKLHIRQVFNLSKQFTNQIGS